MATRWITKKGKNGENRHIPINEGSKVREREISLKNLSENEKFRTIESFSVDGKSYMDALTKILFGKYKNILLDYSKMISDRFYVDNKRVKDVTYVENAGHGSFEYILSKDGEKYVLYGTATTKRKKVLYGIPPAMEKGWTTIWHIDAELKKIIE